jgi:hypothetical protein
MPSHYGDMKNGKAKAKPKKKDDKKKDVKKPKGNTKGLTEKQKKLPLGLQKAILKSKKNKKK